jgi:hypothetical protein
MTCNKVNRIITIAVLASMVVAATPAQAGPPADVLAAPTLPAAKTIDDLMAAIKNAKKPLPAWAIEIAIRAYDAYKTHANGKKVEQVEATVRTVLTEVTALQAAVEAGRELSAEEYRLTRELLDAHGRFLTEISVRLSKVEHRLGAHEVKLQSLADRPAQVLTIIRPATPVIREITPGATKPKPAETPKAIPVAPSRQTPAPTIRDQPYRMPGDTLPADEHARIFANK